VSRFFNAMDECNLSINFVNHQNAPFPVLEEGIYELSLEEFRTHFVYNPIREKQFNGLLNAMKNLKAAGCTVIYVDGSYVTKKPNPGDYDVCVDYTGVNFSLLDPVFLEFDDSRKSQKNKFEGEFFPHSCRADSSGIRFIDFFQNEKYSGRKKGIIKINLTNAAI
jgi:hypothetical protein